MTKAKTENKPTAIPNISAWDASVAINEALKVADRMARAELEEAEALSHGNPYVPGLTARRQLLELLIDVRESYGHDLSQLARANNGPLVA